MDSMQKCEHKVKGKKIGFPPNKKGGKQILKFKWGGGTKGEGGGTIFDSNLVPEKILDKTLACQIDTR